MRRMGQLRRACRGILMADALVGLGIAVVLVLGVGITIAQQSKAERKLAEVRRDMRELETGLLELQAAGKKPAGMDMETLSDSAPAAYVWVRVSKKTESGQVRSVAGLVAVKFVPPGGQGGGAP